MSAAACAAGACVAARFGAINHWSSSASFLSFPSWHTLFPSSLALPPDQQRAQAVLVAPARSSRRTVFVIEAQLGLLLALAQVWGLWYSTL